MRRQRPGQRRPRYPTLFINGRLHVAGYDEATLGEALATASKEG